MPVMYGCDTCSLTLREECSLKVFEEDVLRRIFGPQEGKEQKAGESCIMMSLIVCPPHKIVLG
jgi:hypothetical protein